MAIITQSSINTSNINTGYPVAGVDNPSSGFRNNFSAIKTALDCAENDINAILSKAITNESENALSQDTIITGGTFDSNTFSSSTNGSSVYTLNQSNIGIVRDGTNTAAVANIAWYPTESDYSMYSWSNVISSYIPTIKVNITGGFNNTTSRYSRKYLHFVNNSTMTNSMININRTGTTFKKNELITSNLPISISSGNYTLTLTSHKIVTLKIETYDAGDTILVTPTFIGV